MRHVTTVFALAALLASVARAGPLNPPAGAITSTAKPLAEIEPRIAVNATSTPGDADSVFKITSPGSYYLTGNVLGVAARHGIEIVSAGVTLDLNGFEVRGTIGSLDGVNIGTTGNNVVVTNGSIRGWSDCGIECEYNAGHPPRCTISRINVTACGRDGLYIWSGSRIENCTAVENVGSGISALGGTVVGCLADQNGADGFNINTGCVVADCAAAANTGNGFRVAGGCVLSRCAAEQNDLAGFSVWGSTLSHCSAYLNDGDGIDSSNSSVIADCVSRSNALVGITAGNGSSVSGCAVYANQGTGIIAGNNTQVRDNAVHDNGGAVAANANIQAVGGDARIEGNNCTDAPIGISATSAGNFIARNTCSGNTVNWQVVANNYCLVVLGAPAAAINGDSGGASPGSTNPNANYTY